MFYRDKQTQHTVHVNSAIPTRARMLQQAPGGTKNEIRLVTPCLLRAWNSRNAAKHRNTLLEAGAAARPRWPNPLTGGAERGAS